MRMLLCTCSKVGFFLFFRFKDYFSIWVTLIGPTLNLTMVHHMYIMFCERWDVITCFYFYSPNFHHPQFFQAVCSQSRRGCLSHFSIPKSRYLAVTVNSVVFIYMGSALGGLSIRDFCQGQSLQNYQYINCLRKSLRAARAPAIVQRYYNRSSLILEEIFILVTAVGIPRGLHSVCRNEEALLEILFCWRIWWYCLENYQAVSEYILCIVTI